MVSAIERSRFEPWPGTMCCILGENTKLSQCVSPPRSINGYRKIVGGVKNCGEVTCNRLAARPGGLEILLVASFFFWSLHATKIGKSSSNYEPVMAPKLQFFSPSPDRMQDDTHWLPFIHLGRKGHCERKLPFLRIHGNALVTFNTRFGVQLANH